MLNPILNFLYKRLEFGPKGVVKAALVIDCGSAGTINSVLC